MWELHQSHNTCLWLVPSHFQRIKLSNTSIIHVLSKYSIFLPVVYKPICLWPWSLCSVSVVDLVALAACGGQFDGDSGEVFSPNYTDRYPASSNCKYTITRSSSGDTRLQFLVFQMSSRSCLRNKLEVGKGFWVVSTHTENTQMRDGEPTITLHTLCIFVKEILISSVLLYTDGNFCNNVSDQKGKNEYWIDKIVTTNFTNQCIGRWVSANALELRISLTNLSTWFSWLHIHLQIYEGTSISPATGVHEYCHQSTLPQGDTVIIPGHIVTLVFITDRVTSGTGFRLRYSSKSLCCFYALVDEGIDMFLYLILFSTLKDYSPHMRKEHIKSIYAISRLLMIWLIR